MTEIVETLVETPHNCLSYNWEDGTTEVWGLPFRAECDGVVAAATSPEGARGMVERILARRQPSEGPSA